MNPFDTWPTAGTYYIIAEATSTDENAAEQGNAVRAAGPVLVRPRPDLEASFYTTLPVNAIPGDTTETQYFRISEVNGADAIANIEWKVVASEDLIYDPTDYVIDSGVIAPLAAVDHRNRSFSGNWPTVGNQYNLLAVVSSPDDSNAINDVAVEPDPIDVSTQEQAASSADIEPNGGIGPTTSTTLQSTAIAITGGLDRGMYFKLWGNLDSTLEYDTMKIEIGTAQVVEVWVEWTSGSNDLDLYLWDVLNREWHTSDTSADREPASGRLIVGGWSMGDIIYVGVRPLVGTGSYKVHVVGK
jgi:hypothetical protein